MTWRDAVPLVLAVGVPFAALYGLHRLSRWLTGRRDPIDALIAHNAATSIPGFQRVDWQKADKAGERKWQETLRGQRKARKRPRKVPKNVIDIRRRA